MAHAEEMKNLKEFGFKTSRKEDLDVDGIILELILKYSA
jgi:hypothetical protein